MSFLYRVYYIFVVCSRLLGLVMA